MSDETKSIALDARLAGADNHEAPPGGRPISERDSSPRTPLSDGGCLDQRAARGDRGRFEQTMAKVGAEPPDEQDRL